LFWKPRTSHEQPVLEAKNEPRTACFGSQERAKNGLFWKPRTGQEQLVLELADSFRFTFGVVWRIAATFRAFNHKILIILFHQWMLQIKQMKI
jgi:hypothetical protein